MVFMDDGTGSKILVFFKVGRTFGSLCFYSAWNQTSIATTTAGGNFVKYGDCSDSKPSLSFFFLPGVDKLDKGLVNSSFLLSIESHAPSPPLPLPPLPKLVLVPPNPFSEPCALTFRKHFRITLFGISHGKKYIILLKKCFFLQFLTI